MTVALYARRKGWTLAEVTVTLRYSRVHASDCANCESKHGYMDRIDWRFELTGDLSTEQRARILDIAQRCPVHRTLKSEIDIRPPE
jgi:putative redox protein